MKNNNIEEIINNSGNNFHYQAVDFLRAKGWAVEVSPYYNDNLTEKPREVDIIAEKAYNVHSFGVNRWEGTANVKLFIECKYVNQPTVFWFDKKDKEKAIKRIMDDTGLKHPYDNVNIQQHRFFILNEVAKLFASKKDNQENDLIYKAINQSLNAMIYFKNSASIIPSDPNRVKKILKTINYPVILCNNFDNFFKVEKEAESKGHFPVKDNFNLEINYAYLDKDKKHKEDYFLIDIIDFNNLSLFLDFLEKTDIKIIVENLAWNIRSRKSNQPLANRIRYI